MIVAQNLVRRYGSTIAVDDVSFEIAQGEVVGLLGHNGSGKTTIMKMLTGFLEPTAGQKRGRDGDGSGEPPTKREKASSIASKLP